MPSYAAAARPTTSPRPALGERVRQLRIARGLTQTELAGERFSKEYVSQIERGKTRPTAETVEWLADRLGVDPTFLEIGVSSSERERVESVIARAEAAIESDQYADVVAALTEIAPALGTVAAPELELRALLAEAWARMYLGEVRKAIELLDRAAAHRRGAVVHGRRSRRGPVPPRVLPLQAELDLHGHRALLAGARAGRALRPPRRPPPLARLRVALPLLPAPARLGGCP